MYIARESQDQANLWFVYFQFSDGRLSYSLAAYTSHLKAEVTANFLNVLDQVEDDDTEQLDEINGFLGF